MVEPQYGSRKVRRMSNHEPITMSVPEAGRRYFNLSRNAAYAAAERGEIPTIRIGRLLRVPVRALERLLDGVGRSEADAL
jgi:hypothetical protein